ncbi:MAG: PstS family phosphate ABC transporter substrate-binding protein [Bacteroidetes bacterium]|nr:MAG: PstS family phosphate ABC transporter substrate-binding protein [Bacteroidota bacterium]
MKKFTIIVFIGLALASCGGKKESNNNQLSGTINIDGSSTVYPITEAVAEEFKKIHPDVKVAVALSGTGGGFKKFVRGETDINDASRPITKFEDSVAKSNGIDYIELEVAYDGLAIVVNPQNNWCKDITVAELKKIWEPEAQGKITKWNQIRPEWPNEPIHLYGAGVESGTYDYFTEVIVGESHSSRGDYTSSEDDNVLVQGVSSDKYALGFFGYAYYEENKDKIKLVAVDNGNGPVLPSLETVRNKTYSPLARPLFIYINNKAAERKEVQEFINFYLDNVSQLASEVGYISLSDDEIKSVKEKWEKFLESHKSQK